MTRVFYECSFRICEILCPDNYYSLPNDVAEFLSELTTLKQKTDMLQSLVKIYSEILPSSIQWRALFARLENKFAMKQLQKLNRYHVSENEALGGDQFYVGVLTFHACLKAGTSFRPSYVIRYTHWKP